MRQVPVFDAAPLGIVGDGRVARHFLHYLNLLGLAVRSCSRLNPAAGPIEAFADCSTVSLPVRDEAIVSFDRCPHRGPLPWWRRTDDTGQPEGAGRGFISERLCRVREGL